MGMLGVGESATAPYTKPTLIAHRGASAYAPEHTLPAYQLALDQGADFVEPDLQITKDGVLVCLHDLTLERTTNVAKVFPDPAKMVRGKMTWPVSDFTLEEIRTLDAGSWKEEKYKGTKVATQGFRRYSAFSLDKAFLGKIPMDYTFRYFDAGKMETASDAARKSYAFNPVTGNNYEVREEVLAGYAMGTVKWDWGSAIGGVRVENLKNRGTAVATVGSVTGPVTAESDRTLVFPSLHVNVNLDDTKKLRLSYNSGAARADYDQMRPNVTVSDTNQTISGGNPAVRPELAHGLDAYLEWYVEPQGYLMAGVFFKEVEDVLYRQTQTFGSDALNSNGIDRSGYTYSGITNGGDGNLIGLELAAQFQLDPWVDSLGVPDWMGGFGVSANATFNSSQVLKPAIGSIPARKLRLPGTSDEVYNVSGYYEKYGLSLRLSYQKRSTWLDAYADDLTDAGDTYWAEDDELDFSARYEVNKNVELYFDATNILNNPGRRFAEPGNLLNIELPYPSPSPATTQKWQ
jgi:TonB-dependent receptor